MAVATTRFVGAGLYVPFRGVDRAVSPVGTYSIDAQATGDGSGGTVDILMNMSYIEFGFHPILVMTRVTALDELATPIGVRFRYAASGNERLEANIDQLVLAVAGVGAVSYTEFNALPVVIEPIRDGGDVMAITWATNENADTYHLHLFGLLFDAEAMARTKEKGSAIDMLLAGIR